MKIVSLSPPRIRDAARTREAILRAAQLLFAQQGYTTTGVREVAAEAGVNSTLIRRYFKSKEGLFRAAVVDTLIIEPFITGDRSGFGDRAVSILKAGENRASALAMMMLATANADARALCSELMQNYITAPLANWLGGENAMARASQINMLWIGYMSARQVLPLTGLAGQAMAETHAWLGVTIQAIVDKETRLPAARPFNETEA